MNKQNLLIIKTGASGDVVRTTCLLHEFKNWEIDWLTAPENRELLENNFIKNIFTDPLSLDYSKNYDLVINLEDDVDFIGKTIPKLRYKKIFGAFLNSSSTVHYTEEAAGWFDLGLISKYGLKKANELKYQNKKTYQELIFDGLGLTFSGQPYVMPSRIPTPELKGDLAVAPKAGNRWPIKNWRYFDKLIDTLSQHYTVNVLPIRSTLVEHIADIKGHKFLISPDSLPMHIGMGLNIPGVAIFTCTSPWEIYDYKLLKKVISPKLEKYWYSRKYNEDAVTCLGFQEVYDVVQKELKRNNV